MIGKGRSIAYTAKSIAYGMNQEKGAEVVLKQYLSGETPQEITEEFRAIQSQNHTCIKNTLSFVISPTIEDGRSLKTRDLARITEKFMKEMQLSNRQAIAFVHSNRPHVHIHLYVNRISLDGQVYRDSFIGKRSQHAADRVAKDLGLTTVREVQKEKALEMIPIRIEIRQIHDRVIEQHRPKDFDQYIDNMGKEGVTVKPYINRQGKLQGFRFEYKGESLKGSEVHRNMGMSRLAQQIDFSKDRLKEIADKSLIRLADKAIPINGNVSIKLAKRALKIMMKASRGAGIEI